MIKRRDVMATAALRLAKVFVERIETGVWPVGGRVPTTRALAAEFGVSVNTVQDAFRELQAADLVERRPRTGGIVKGAARQRGRSERAVTIGVVAPYIDVDENGAPASGTWTHRIIQGCDRELGEAGMHVSMFWFDDQDPDALGKVLAKVDRAGSELGGIFAFMRPCISALPAALDQRDLGWVSVNPPREHATQNFVAQDVLPTARIVGRCLSGMGVERVMLIGDRIVVGRSTADVYLGFMQGWLENGRRSRDVDFVQTPDVREPAGYEHVRQHLKTFGRPGAIFGFGDLLAIGAMRALREEGLQVGRDVHVIGATGLELAAYANPPLTVSEVPMEQMGREAGRMLLEMSREGVRRMVGRYIPTRLIVRESCPIPAELLAEQTAAVAAEAGP
jgi:LacI family transcriptional regulator